MKKDSDALADLSTDLAEMIAQRLPGQGELASAVPGLRLYHWNAPLVGACQVYEPAFAVVAQGAKAVEVGSEIFSFNERSWLLTPLHLPATSRITKASPRRPYLACSVLLDMEAAREMISELDAVPDNAPAKGPAVTTGPMTVDLLEPILRIVRLN